MSFVADAWNWVDEEILHPVGNLFTRPKSVFGESSNWIADLAVPAVAGMVPYVGPALAAAYGGVRGWEKMALENRTLNRDQRAAGQPETGNDWWDYTKSIGGGLVSGYASGAAGKAALGGVQSMLGSGATNATNYGSTIAGMNMGGAGTGTALGSASAFGGANVGLGGAAAAGISGAATGAQNYGANSMLAARDTFGNATTSSAGFGGGGVNSATNALKTTGVATAGGSTASADFMSKLTNPMTIMGAGGLLMSQLGTTATPPNVGATAAKWLTSDAVTRAGKQAREMIETEYLEPWEPNNEMQAFMEIQEKDIRKRFKYRAEEMDKMGLGSNEQFMNSGERLEMHKRLGDQEEHEVSLMQQNWMLTAKQQYSVNQYNYIMKELDADEATKQNLLYADMADVMWKYNMEQEEVLNFRKIAADAGMYLISQGMGGVQ